ncbi:HTH-type transcriptional regulator UlaR [Anatilimnocola aggregata]|uniref:HTH-type transcriptional regulator UlaR n=1 Tax=Anatilimnocola aggregata TaxID=2528021 RepID=A0A517YIB3_9BACT|nr:DeoR/GlpR family DNA-binding transcription regulator [Anatilimnocola aggregata]QDU29951.1 HTH-type transcriptional regulator UlaR [Anatilimnocola aggregata]
MKGNERLIKQLLADERRGRLSELIRQRGFASLPELASQLQVSESTVRRDLDFLEETGVARRTHGGVFYTGPSPKLAHFDQRQSSNWDKKRRIAAAAARLIEDNDTVLLDGGSTTYELAQLLVGRPLQVVTNSLPVANLFTSSDQADLVFVGGYVHSRTGVSLGPYANQMLASLNARRAVLSVAGINERGCYNSNLLLVETERAMMAAAEQVIVVADSTKFGHTSLALMCPLDKIDVLVSDHELSREWQHTLAQSGTVVRLAAESGDTTSPETASPDATAETNSSSTHIA